MLCSASVKLALATASSLNGMQSSLEGLEFPAIDEVLPRITAQVTPTRQVSNTADKREYRDANMSIT